MAAGFKSATVNASSVPSTQTNFPAYVDLSRVGITTLAEAQSVRVYADSAKTTEWAREIVSATEMHVKVPSLTSTVTIYVDYNGVRADYAVTDTFGRNAVWSAYIGVWHLDEAVNNTAGGYADSTGKGNNGTGVSMAEAPVAGKIGGNAASFDGISDYINAADSASLDEPNTNNAVAFTAILKSDSVAQGTYYGFGKSSDQYNMIFDFAADTYEFWGNSADARFNIGTSTDVTNWLFLGASFNGATDEGIANFNGTTTTSTEIGTLPAANTGPFVIGGVLSGGGFTTFSQAFDGKVDELRVRSSAVTANWMTTEYNNLFTESAFWGTWANVGGGNTGNFFAFF